MVRHFVDKVCEAHDNKCLIKENVWMHICAKKGNEECEFITSFPVKKRKVVNDVIEDEHEHGLHMKRAKVCYKQDKLQLELELTKAMADALKQDTSDKKKKVVVNLCAPDKNGKRGSMGQLVVMAPSE